VFVLLLASASAPFALACSPGAVLQSDLDASDIVAIGRIHVIERTEQKSDGETTVTGIAELRTDETLRNRTPLAAPYVFSFEKIRDDGCIFGEDPSDGVRVKIYLKRMRAHPEQLVIVHIESLEQ
jgi:hypothetical protein